MRRACFQLISIIGLLILTEKVYASFPLPPRLSAEAYASDYAIGQADVLLPVLGDDAHNLYVDPSIAYGSDNQGYADLGLGYRWIQHSAAILGVYLFGGYTRIDNNARLWVANPGIEALGSRWDAHLNAYFPMGDRNQMMEESSSFSANRFAGHSQFLDNSFYLFQSEQHAGSGADVKVGYQLFPGTPLKGYLGSYFFAPSDVGDIWGGAAGLEFWLTQYLKAFASYTYDNVRHSTGAFGLGVELGGTHVHRSDPALEERITDPVERYLAELGRGSAIPSRTNTQVFTSNSSQLVLDNIAFFSPTGDPPVITLSSCTYENPCGPQDFNQSSIDTLAALLPNTVFYFNGGNYPAVDDFGTGPVSLNAGQSVHSRTSDYSQPAIGAARSTFTGFFILADNTTLENIILLSPPIPGSILSGVEITDANNALITGSQLGNASDPFFRTILNDGGGAATIKDSELFSDFISVLLANSPTPPSLTIQNSTINVISSGNSGGIVSRGSSFVAVSDSQINLTGVTNPSGALVPAFTSTIIANRVDINVVGGSGSGTPGVYGVLGSSSGVLQFNNGRINVLGQGITNGHPGTQISNSTCMLNGSPPAPC